MIKVWNLVIRLTIFQRPFQDLELSSPSTENIRTYQTTGTCVSDRGYDKAPKSTLKIEDVDYGALERLNIQHKMTPPDVHGGQRSSFEHVPIETSGFNLDDKYNMQGRFAFDVDELPVQFRDRRSYDEDHLLKLSLYTESPREDSVNTCQLHLNRSRNEAVVDFRRSR